MRPSTSVGYVANIYYAHVRTLQCQARLRTAEVPRLCGRLRARTTSRCVRLVHRGRTTFTVSTQHFAFCKNLHLKLPLWTRKYNGRTTAEEGIERERERLTVLSRAIDCFTWNDIGKKLRCLKFTLGVLAP